MFFERYFFVFSEMIRDFIHEFRSLQYNRSLKGLTGEQVFNGVAAIIYPRQKQQVKKIFFSLVFSGKG